MTITVLRGLPSSRRFCLVGMRRCRRIVARSGSGQVGFDAEPGPEALLLPPVESHYLPSGHCYKRPGLTAFLPGNGGLLAAPATMAAGWTGGPERPAPGFPVNDRWSAHHEDLRRWLRQMRLGPGKNRLQDHIHANRSSPTAQRCRPTGVFTWRPGRPASPRLAPAVVWTRGVGRQPDQPRSDACGLAAEGGVHQPATAFTTGRGAGCHLPSAHISARPLSLRRAGMPTARNPATVRAANPRASAR